MPKENKEKIKEKKSKDKKKIQELEEQIEKLKADVDHWKNEYYRAYADTKLQKSQMGLFSQSRELLQRRLRRRGVFKNTGYTAALSRKVTRRELSFGDRKEFFRKGSVDPRRAGGGSISAEAAYIAARNVKLRKEWFSVYSGHAFACTARITRSGDTQLR